MFLRQSHRTTVREAQVRCQSTDNIHRHVRITTHDTENQFRFHDTDNGIFQGLGRSDMIFLGKECPVTDKPHGFGHSDNLLPPGDSLFYDLGFSRNKTNQPERFIPFLVNQVTFLVHFTDTRLPKDGFAALIQIDKKGIGTVNTNITILLV